MINFKYTAILDTNGNFYLSGSEVCNFKNIPKNYKFNKFNLPFPIYDFYLSSNCIFISTQKNEEINNVKKRGLVSHKNSHVIYSKKIRI